MNRLGLTTQNPIRPVYLTFGPTRQLYLYALVVQLHLASKRQLVAPNSLVRDTIRALNWLGPGEVEESLQAVWDKLCDAQQGILVDARAEMPCWLAVAVSRHSQDV